MPNPFGIEYEASSKPEGHRFPLTFLEIKKISDRTLNIAQRSWINGSIQGASASSKFQANCKNYLIGEPILLCN